MEYVDNKPGKFIEPGTINSDSYIMQLEKELETIVNIEEIDDDYEEMKIIARELYNRTKEKHC